jgi:DNA-binding response OmpR family regulator
VDPLKKILVVEDEKSHQMIIEKSLSGHFAFDLASSFAEAVEKMRKEVYSLFLLDVMLGEQVGFDLVAPIRAFPKYKMTPIVFLTSRDDISSKVLGFTLGADDYLTKPFDPRELRARLQVRLARVVPPQAQVDLEKFQVGSLSFSFVNQAAYADTGGGRRQLDLTPIEYKMLYFMAHHCEEALSRGRILNQVWGENTHVNVRSVDTYVAALRKKMKPVGIKIQAVHGVGYRLTTPTIAVKAA